jgi:hypothetical protein
MSTTNSAMRYKDYPKHDFRRCLAVLQTIDELGERATVHYAAQALACTRAEVSRAIELAHQQFRVVFEKTGSIYRIASWGYISRAEVTTMFRPALQLEQRWHDLEGSGQPWTREREAALTDAIAEAVAMHRSPASDRQADIYRLSAQLLKTNHQEAARFLDQAAQHFYKKARVAPRPFSRVVADGLVREVPRLRNLLEKRLGGVSSW